MKDSPVETKYGIDQEKPYFFDNCVAFRPEDNLEAVDAIIVTSVYYYPEIKKKLQRMSCPVLSLADIVNSM